MSDRKPNESKSTGWNDWAQKKNDWNMTNNKRPKLDIHKNHSSQFLSINTASGSGAIGPSTKKGGSFRRTNSMPTSSNASPVKDVGEGFVDSVQEEFDAEEAKALAEAAAAIESEIAQSQSAEQNNPASSIPKPLNKIAYKNNGSSGFENLFQEELAEEDIEECMLLASQEIQASQNAHASAKTPFSQAYKAFSKGVDAHSSLIETRPTFRKPSAPSSSALNKVPKVNANRRDPVSVPVPPIRTLNFVTNGTAQSRSSNINNARKESAPSNPQAEVEVRRLAKLNDESASEIKSLRDNVRTKEGEVSILRAQLRVLLVEAAQQKSRSKHSAAASEQQFKEKLNEMEKELETLRLELQFQKAEAQTAKERYKMLSNTSERVRLVDPRSPGASSQCSVTPKPMRQRQVSGFLNRSTFEEPLSPRRPAMKRQRVNEEEEEPILDFMPPIEPAVTDVIPKTKTVGEQTEFDAYQLKGARRPSPITLGQNLSERLVGVQLVSVDFSNSELWRNDNASFDEKETVPTLSLLKTGPKVNQRCVPLDENNRPRLMNCAQSLKHLMSWNDTNTDCTPSRTAICQIAEECTGILHYNLLWLQDIGCPSGKELRDRDHEIISRGVEVVPLKSFDLLDEKHWYKEEYGIEMRRCLGILSEVALASHFAASLVSGACEPSEISIRKHKFTELPDYAFVNKCQSNEDEERYYLLRVLCDICYIIVNQKLTLAFNGVLAGILRLLRNCFQHGVVQEKGQSFILDIIRQVLIARPSSFVLQLLVELLTSVSACQAIMRGLCTRCDEDDNVFDNSNGLCSFTISSCPLQLLCTQLRAVTEDNRWCLINSTCEWLVAVIAQGSLAPSWILSSSGDNNESHNPCCIRLTSTLIWLLSDAFEMLQDTIEKEEVSTPTSACNGDVSLKPTLTQVMRRSIILLHKLVENHMFQYMARVEGLYELLVQGIERLQQHLQLSSSLKRYLEDLLRTEQETVSNTDQVATDAPHLSLYLDSDTTVLNLK